jgi:hypothetical protein
MKIQKTEFKAIIRECLKELITEGALDHMVGGMMSERSMAVQQQAMMSDPRIQQLSTDSYQAQIFAETAMNSDHVRQAGSTSIMGGAAMMQEQYGAQVPTYATQQRNPLPPREQQQAMQQQGGQQQPASRWANLAFSKPLSNRPSSGGGPGGTHLPGSKMGSF